MIKDFNSTNDPFNIKRAGQIYRKPISVVEAVESVKDERKKFEKHDLENVSGKTPLKP